MNKKHIFDFIRDDWRTDSVGYYEYKLFKYHLLN
jgi:hypothetical protein